MTNRRIPPLVPFLGILALLIAICIAVLVGGRRRQTEPPPPPRPEPPVEFVAASEGYHTAWLLAGPFEKPLPRPGEIADPREGAKLSGKSWRLLTSPEGLVDVSRKGSGTHYATGTLISRSGGARKIQVMAAGPTRLWLGGKLLGATKPGLRVKQEAEFDVKLQPSRTPIVVETAAERGGAGFILLLLDGERAAPEPLALKLSGSKRSRLAKLLAKTLHLVRRDREVWAEPGGDLGLTLVRAASAPRLGGQIEVKCSARPAAAKEAAPSSRKIPAARFLAGPLELGLAAPGEQFLELECAVELVEPAGKTQLARKTCRLYSKRGLAAGAKELAEEARRTGEKLGAEKVALPLLRAEKASLWLSTFSPGEREAKTALTEIEEGRAALAELRKGRDPLDGAVGWVERAYRCPIDGSAQPYRLYVPKRLADPAERQGGSYPLVVYLHGYVQSYDKHYWVEEADMEEVNALMERFGVIMLMPFGRSNTDFVSVGEVDVLRAIEETCRLYPVDRSRIYLYGYSMGGYGAYTIAAHFPDRFAAMMVLAGRPEPYYIERQALAGMPRARQPRYKGYCLDVDTPLELAVNLKYVPALIYHAKRDALVPAEGAQKMAARLKALGGRAELKEVDGDHWSGFDVLTSPEPVTWLLAHKRPKRPAQVTVRTYSPRFGKSHWVSIESIDKWTRPAELAVREDGKGNIQVKAENVREFTLSGVPAPEGFRVAGARGFNISAIEVAPGVRDIHGRLSTAPKEGRWRKTARLPGPMKEACNTPFVVVYGPSDHTGGGGVPPNENMAKALRFAEEWRVFAKGKPPVKSEAELTEEDKKTKSIILFCAPLTSGLLAEAAPTLECKVTPAAFEIAGKKAAARGLVLTRPSPWAPKKDRYLVICTGLFYGEGTAENHKLDLIPDFIVFTSGQEGQGEPPAVLAGYFDSDWKADPKLVETFEVKKQPEPAPALRPGPKLWDPE